MKQQQTQQQLNAAILSTSFEGASGQLAFAPNGDRSPETAFIALSGAALDDHGVPRLKPLGFRGASGWMLNGTFLQLTAAGPDAVSSRHILGRLRRMQPWAVLHRRRRARDPLPRGQVLPGRCRGAI